MQYEMKGILAVVVIILALIVIFKVAKKVLKLVILGALVIALLVGMNIIDLNTLSPEIQQKVDAVASAVGDTFIRVEGKSVLVKLGNDWYDISKIAVLGDLATDSVTLKYDDQEIYVGETGIMNVLRVLESVGLIHSD